MSDIVRAVLIAGAVFTFFFVLKGVKKAKFRASETFFWLLISILFVLLGIFPGIADWLSAKLGVMSPINLVFLVVIFLLLIKVFTMDRKLAKTEHQLTEMAQKTAIERLQQERKEGPEN